MNDRPWLSVIVPSFNGELYLAEALSSVVVQNDADIEVILVDDGSTDRSLEIAQSFESKLSLSIVRREHRGNWANSTNLGLGQAKGEFISILHQDDVWEAGRLSALRSALKENPAAELILHPSQLIDHNGRVIGNWTCPFQDLRSLSPQYLLERLVVQNFIAIPAPLFRRETLVRIGGLDESLWFTADWQCWLKFAVLGNWIYLDKLLANFRIHLQSQTIQGGRSLDDYRAQYETVLNQYLPIAERTSANPKQLASVARFSIAMNIFLLSRLKGWQANWREHFTCFARLSPRGWWLYLTRSRLTERLLPRLRMQLRGGL